MKLSTKASDAEFLASVNNKPLPKVNKVKVTFVDAALLYAGTSVSSFLASVSDGPKLNITAAGLLGC
jgi:hypothetical protein